MVQSIGLVWISHVPTLIALAHGMELYNSGFAYAHCGKIRNLKCIKIWMKILFNKNLSNLVQTLTFFV